tara:strand:- start:10101 stop:10247 length:147 start_codon:yes stop_codon:yes gene_type:complete
VQNTFQIKQMGQLALAFEALGLYTCAFFEGQFHLSAFSTKVVRFLVYP